MNRDLNWARSRVRAPVRTAAILIVAAAALLFAAPAGAGVRRSGPWREAGGGVERSVARPRGVLGRQPVEGQNVPDTVRLGLRAGRVGAGRQRPGGGRVGPGDAHDLRRQRQQRQRPQRRREHGLGDRHPPLPRAGRLALQGAVADDHGREPAERDRDRRADRHRVRRPTSATTRSRCSTAQSATRWSHRGAGRRRRRSRWGCGRSSIFADPANHTVYVAQLPTTGPGDSTTSR